MHTYHTNVYRLKRGMYKRAWMKIGMYAIELCRDDQKLSLYACDTEDQARAYAAAWENEVRTNGGRAVDAASVAYDRVIRSMRGY